MAALRLPGMEGCLSMPILHDFVKTLHLVYSHFAVSLEELDISSTVDGPADSSTDYYLEFLETCQ